MSSKSSELLETGISLADLGISGRALDRASAIRFLILLKEEGASVLGGDVFKYQNGNIVSTIDSWYSKKGSIVNPAENSTISINQALDYINRYPDTGELYLIVVDR